MAKRKHHGYGGGKIGYSSSHGQEESSLAKKIFMAAGVLIFIAGMSREPSKGADLALFLVSYLLIGGEVLLRAAKNILKGKIFDENFLISAATIGAFAIGAYQEGVAVMLFYQIGEAFQYYVVGKNRNPITALTDICPNFITRFIRYYTPVVVFAAIALALIPPLLFSGDWANWMYRALIFLVVSCPCALVISIPLLDTEYENGSVVFADDDMLAYADDGAAMEDAIKISKKIRKIAMQNIVFALAVKGILLITGAFGIIAMWMAALSDVGVALITVLYAMRAMKETK